MTAHLSEPWMSFLILIFFVNFSSDRVPENQGAKGSKGYREEKKKREQWLEDLQLEQFCYSIYMLYI